METEPHKIAKQKRGPLSLSFWIRLLVAVGLLVAIVNLVNMDDFIVAFQQASILHVLAAAILLVVNMGIQFFKWNYMIRFLGDIPRKDVLASFFFGMTLGSFTPGQLGEFGGRAIHLPARERGTIIGLAVIDKLQMFGIMAFAGIGSLLLLFDVHSTEVILLAAVISVLILFFLLRFSAARLLLLKIGVSKLRHPWVMQAVDSLSLFRAKDILITTCMTIMFYATIYCQLYLLMNAFQQIGLYDSFVAYASMMFSKALLPFSIADLGIREFGLVYFTSKLGYPSPAALASSLLLFVINIAVPALIGLFFIPHTISFPQTK